MYIYICMYREREIGAVCVPNMFAITIIMAPR